MKAPSRTRSLKFRIVISYSLILILGGLSTSAIGILVTGRALLQQARQQIRYGLSAARSIYDHQLLELNQSVELLASSGRLQSALAANQPGTVAQYLTGIRHERGLDFLSVTDATGKVIVRTSGPGTVGDVVDSLAPVNRALAGKSAAGTEVLSQEILRAEDPTLAERAAIKLVATPQSKPTEKQALDAGLTLLAAAPATDENGRIIAVVYAGKLLNHPNTDFITAGTHPLVDKIIATLSPGLRTHDEFGGAATIFQEDVRISTSVTDADGRRVIGTLAPADVRAAVIGQNEPWIGRAYLFGNYYVSGYEPITDLAGKRVGMLAVGVLEQPYTAVRDSVTLSFAAIALLCFVSIVVVTYFLTRSLVRPLEEMVSVSQSIAAGDLSRRVRLTTDQSEFGLLAVSFNDMLDNISEMNTQLEQWARTLEARVENRTEQLVKVQTQVARQQRLASVGQLAAGVAHEINNPLGGILTFASLVLEDLPEDSPSREDLEQIVEQAERCRTIVAGLLEFSRQHDPHMAGTDINALISRTLALLEKQAIFHDIAVARRFQPDLPQAFTDESQMQQVFMNIILNAVDAMDQRGELTVETGQDDRREEVFVRISDTGCGIKPEIREAIFNPFFTTKDPGKGTGLGLAVACRIVQAHGGRTEVESEVNKGTTFTIHLPMVAPGDREPSP